MIETEIAFNAYGRSVQFWMQLEPTELHDGHMLAHFERGACYEAEIAWVMLHTLHEGDFAIDVGANNGFFSLLMSRLVGPGGMVFAFEPAPDNLDNLAWNLQRNAVKNVQVIEKPAWCREEEVTFYMNSDSRGSHALFDPANWEQNVKSVANPRPTKMQATTLDALDISKERVKLIKIDTEGAEQRVLEGAAELLAAFHPPYIVAEMNPHGLQQAGCSAESLRAFMRESGYEMFFLHPQDLLPSYAPAKVQTRFMQGIGIINVLFSTVDDVVKAWPEAMG